MFFILRSAACISVVVASLPSGAALVPDRGAVVAAAGRLAAASARQACARSPARCWTLAAPALADLPTGSIARSSRDTLTRADLVPQWTGKARFAVNVAAP